MIAPARWIAVLRVVVGAWFVKAVWTKLAVGLLWGVLPYPTVSARFLAFQPRRVAEFAHGNPVGWYRDVLEGIVLPHAATFAALQTLGEIAVGVGLVLGLLIPLSALVGLFLTLTFGLATQWMSTGQQGFHVMLSAAMIVFLGSRAGRVWGVDGWLRCRAPRSRLMRILT